MDRYLTTIIFTLLNLISLVTLVELCPRECSCDTSTKTVKCRNQGVTRFNIDGNTRTVDLSGNRLRSCGILSEYSHLEWVILSDNLLRNVSDACFHKAVTLELLDLSFNKLRALPNMTKGPVIYSLNLTGNLIVELKPIAWYGLSSLRELVLDNNGLHIFSGEELLQETDALEVLSLRNNKIRRFCSNVTRRLFLSAIRLKELYISNNTLLERNSSWLMGAPNLEILDLRSAYCSVNHSQDNGWVFPGYSTRLKYLDLSHNKLLSFAPWAFSGCENLEKINLTNCSLNELRVGQLQDMKKLTHLYADYNSIGEISSSLFFDLRELEVLSMRFNNLRSSKVSSIAFRFTESIEVLDFSNNDLENLTFLLHDDVKVNNLTRLIVDYNRIANFSSINKFSNLKVFSAYKNSLQRIPNINGLCKLQHMNLASNNITVLELNTFWTTSSPVWIDLSNNKIDSVSRGDIGTFTNAAETTWSVILHGNPLKCTCREDWFQQETKYKVYNSSLIRLYENLQYSCPESHNNISHALDISECVFIHRDALIVIGCLLLLVCCCAVLAAGMTLGKRLERRHHTNSSEGRKKPDSEKKLISSKEVTHDRRADTPSTFMIAEKDQHLKDAMSLSNLKGSMVRLDNQNVKPFFREIYV